MASRFLLLLLPALAVAKINIDITGSMNGGESELRVNYSGMDSSVISDVEARTFKLNDNTIKEAVKAYFGERPHDTYIRSPTPWGDLYRTYSWEQVTRNLRPISAKVLSINAQPQILMEQVFENNSTRTAAVNVGITQTVSNSISTGWSKGGDLSVDQEIKYGFNIDAASIGGSSKFSFSSVWGYAVDKTEQVSVGSSTGLELQLEPYQSAVAELQATRGTALVEIEYEATLSGIVAVNYDPVYKGHHFWNLSIGEVMKAGGIVNRVLSKEVIEIGFFTDTKVVVRDRLMKKVLLQHNV